MLLVGNRVKSAVPTSHARGFKKLIRLHYSPEDGVYPLFSKYSGEMLLNYVNKKAVIKYNLLIEGSMDENKTVEEVIIMYRKYSDDAAKLNGAGEYWNWSFMWLCFASPWMHNFLDVFFGGYDNFKKLWKEACHSLFGSGWVWLVDNDGFYEILPSQNSGTPVGLRAMEPVLCINLWEQAYFFDYGHDKDAYIEAFFGSINWGFVEGRLKAAPKSKKVFPHPESFTGDQDINPNE